MDVTKFNLFDWDVTWGSFALGAVDKVTPKLSLKLKEKKCGTIGDVILGHWIVALEGSIDVEAKEIDHTFFEKTIPWNAGQVNASVPIFPSSLNADLYSNAAKLVLHPHHLAANNTVLDLTLIKAVPLLLGPGEADGVEPNKTLLSFIFYPNRDDLATALVYGWIGPEPA